MVSLELPGIVELCFGDRMRNTELRGDMSVVSLGLWCPWDCVPGITAHNATAI